jgi:hypothetical protein
MRAEPIISKVLNFMKIEKSNGYAIKIGRDGHDNPWNTRNLCEVQ